MRSLRNARRNKPAPYLTRGRMRGGVATNKKRLLPRRRDGEAAGKQTGVFQQPFLKKEVNLFFDVAWNNLKYDSPS
jgi:hypothetical protein